MEQCFVHIRGYIEVAINRAISEFDFKRAKPFAISDRCERRRFDGVTSDVRDNAGWFRRRRRIGVQSSRDENQTRH